jgi:acetyl-CoA acetyltransferase
MRRQHVLMAGTARAAAIAAGFREHLPRELEVNRPLCQANTSTLEVVNRFCSSGLMAISVIANQIRNKEIECVHAIAIDFSLTLSKLWSGCRRREPQF